MKHQIWEITLETHDDYLGKIISQTGDYYESEILNYSLEHLNEGDGVIFDVGANIWNHTVFWASHWLGVIFFEPIEENFSLASKNLNNNNLWFICEWQSLGVSNRLWKMNMETHRTNMWACRKSETWREVFLSTLDIKTGAMSKDIQLIKVDVEGMELRVLQGAFLTIQRFLPDLIVEINNKQTMRYIEFLWYKAIFRENKTLYLKHKIKLWME